MSQVVTREKWCNLTKVPVGKWRSWNSNLDLFDARIWNLPDGLGGFSDVRFWKVSPRQGGDLSLFLFMMVFKEEKRLPSM